MAKKKLKQEIVEDVEDVEACYKFSNKLTRDVVIEVLEVEKSNGLTPKNILERAKDSSSNLHNLFEWDNSVAAEKFRLEQARGLIQNIKIIVGEKMIRGFESVRVIVNDTGEMKNTYLPIMDILSNEEYREQKIVEALNNITYWRAKFQDLKELKPIFVSIDKVLKQRKRKKK